MSGIREAEQEQSSATESMEGSSADEYSLDGSRAERLMRRILDGDATWRVLNGTAGVVDLKVVSRQIVEGCEEKINDAVIALAETHDLSSDEAKKAHFDLRVNGEILRRLNDIIKIGVEARRKAMIEEEEDDE